jgi:hypothetical protein
MFIPEGVGAKYQNETFETGTTDGKRKTWTHHGLVERARININELNRQYLEYSFKAGKPGEERVEHFIIVAPPAALKLINQDFNKMQEKRLIDTLAEMEREDSPDYRLN